ncbi:MAG: hypothetical protein VW397_01155, partial [Candidatus Margulisiibacteriota bacterium]
PDRIEGNTNAVNTPHKLHCALSVTKASSPQTMRVISIPPQILQFKINLNNISQKITDLNILTPENLKKINLDIDRLIKEVKENSALYFPYLQREIDNPGSGISKWREDIKLGSVTAIVKMESKSPIPLTPVQNHFIKLADISNRIKNTLDKLIKIEQRILQAATKIEHVTKTDIAELKSYINPLLTVLVKILTVNADTLKQFQKNKPCQLSPTYSDAILTPIIYTNNKRHLNVTSTMPNHLLRFAAEIQDIDITSPEAMGFIQRFYPEDTENLHTNHHTYLKSYKYAMCGVERKLNFDNI